MTEIEKIYKVFLSFPNVSTDTRDIKAGSMFFALKGENFDANEYALQALEKGAAFAVVDDKSLEANDRFLFVDDVLSCLQDLAKHHRKVLGLPIIGITGSNGKTTTKELMHAVLSKQYNVLATAGNFNNHIGVPLTLLRLNKDHELAIIEMGANHIGEIEFLSGISDPDYGIITNIGKAHLKGFGSYEGVKKAKTELYKFIKSKSGKLFVNNADPVLLEQSSGIERILYGKGSDFEGSFENSEDGKIVLKVVDHEKTLDFRTNLFGTFNFDNLMCAFAVGKHFNVDIENIEKAFSEYQPKNNRSQIVKTEFNTIILDAYNANPSSVNLALRSFDELKGEKKMLIVGDMLELGDESEAEHRKVIDLIKNINPQEVFLVGPIFQSIKGNEFNCFENVEALNKHLKQSQFRSYQILVKGSRAIQLEKVLDYIL